MHVIEPTLHAHLHEPSETLPINSMIRTPLSYLGFQVARLDAHRLAAHLNKCLLALVN